MGINVTPHITKSLRGIEYKPGFSRQQYVQRLRELKAYLDYVKEYISGVQGWSCESVTTDLESRISYLERNYAQGDFRLKKDFTTPTNVTMYECVDCLGHEHSIIEVSNGFSKECWPSWFNQCTRCGLKTGPWVPYGDD